MKENLTAATRKTILAIKEALLHLPTQYASIFIYQAGLEFGIRHVDEFLRWTKYHNTTVPFYWQRTLANKLGLKKFPIINYMIIGIISYDYSNSLRNSAADFGESRLNGISNTVFAPLSPA